MKINFYEILISFLLKKYQKAIKYDILPIDKIETIVIYSNTAIGDTLFNTPVFRSLKNNFPNKKIIVILNPTNYKLFENNPYIDEILLYDGRWKTFFSVLKKLKKIKIDLTLILHANEPQATPLSVLSNSKFIIKIPNDKNKYHEFHNNKQLSCYGDRHGIYDRLRALEYLGINEQNTKMELFVEEENNLEVENKFIELKIDINQDKIIGFQIGASNLSRMWFEDNWIKLGKKLLENNENLKIVLTGAPNEKEMTHRVLIGINSDRVFNLAGEFNIKSAAGLIGKCNLLITPDTGPLHIAAALNTPTIAFYVVAQWYSSNPCFNEHQHLYVQKEKTCVPCIGKSCKYQECMLQITVDEVLKKVDEIGIFKL
jgi:ADP-heptose:LPS heptosyltransferase